MSNPEKRFAVKGISELETSFLMDLKTAINGFVLARLSDGYSPNTMQNYTWALTKLQDFLGDPDLDMIAQDDIRRFFLSLRTDTELASSSIQSIWRSIRSFYNWASNELGIDRPDKIIPMPRYDNRAIVPYMEEDIKALLSMCDRTAPAQTGRRKGFTMRRPTADRDRAIILTLLDTVSDGDISP